MSHDEGLFPCPCCGHRTLAELHAWEICAVCGWEDDGQDNDDASVVRGGPNSDLSLVAGRINFLVGGSCEPVGSGARGPVEEHSDFEPGRVFVRSDDGRAVSEPSVGWAARLP